MYKKIINLFLKSYRSGSGDEGESSTSSPDFTNGDLDLLPTESPPGIPLPSRYNKLKYVTWHQILCPDVANFWPIFPFLLAHPLI